ncbi:MAG TPA: dethiobiotin synthase [Deltaproteobacteria bacterium]|nr:dethiobiotin synthase [Deltaproteobacteria bacterium]
MRLFITGTDTGVGKTLITRALAAAARASGGVVAAKPVASGVPPGEPGEDAVRIAAAAGHPPLCLASFAAPVSPHRAALLEARTLPGDLLDRIAALRADTVLVEGVGGWAVPLSLEPPLWVADLARATGGAVVVVADDRLGVINHTLLTVAAIQQAELPIAAVILNRRNRADPDASRASNLEDLSLLLDIPVVSMPTVDPDHDAEVTQLGGMLLRTIRAALPPR